MEILGIDIGGSGIKGAVVDTSAGTFLGERCRLDTPRPAIPQEIAGVVTSKRLHKFSSYLDVRAPVVPARLLNRAGIIGAALAAERGRG